MKRGLSGILLLLLVSCGGEIVLDGGDIPSQSNHQFQITELTPAQLILTANTGTVSVPIGVTLQGVRGSAIVHLEVQNGDIVAINEYQVLTYVAGAVDIRYSANLLIDTNQLTSGMTSTLSAYAVLSNPTVTSNELSAVIQVQ